MVANIQHIKWHHFNEREEFAPVHTGLVDSCVAQSTSFNVVAVVEEEHVLSLELGHLLDVRHCARNVSVICSLNQIR